MEFPNYKAISEQMIYDFLNEKTIKAKVVELAGIVFLYEGMILLCYPKNKRTSDQWSIPKGRVDPGEDPKESAIRETYEEIGIKVKGSDLKHSGKIIFEALKNEIKVLYYWVYQVKNLADIGLKDIEIPASQLAGNEMQKAKFFTLEEANIFIKDSYTDVLRKIKKLI